VIRIEEQDLDTIYFDLDGTLTDPKIGITRSIQYALDKLGHPAIPSEDELTWCIGPPLRGSFTKLLGHEHSSDLAVSLYRERFADIGIFENNLYAGIPDILIALARPDRRLFVATSKPVVFAEQIIDHFGLRSHFERVFGSELDGTRSDKTDLLKYALQETSVDPSRAIMIGDRSHDIIGARNNGMNAIGVLYGYGSKEELTEAGALHVCARPRGLLEHLA
jgi:phosphoglycolate phosphatase